MAMRQYRNPLLPNLGYAGQAIPSLVSVKMRTLYGNFLEDEGLLPASRRVIRRRAYGWVPLVSLSEMWSILKRIDVHKDLCEFNGLMTRVVKPISKLGIDEYQYWVADKITHDMLYYST